MGTGTGIGSSCCSLALLPEVCPGIGQTDVTRHVWSSVALLCLLLMWSMTLSQLICIPSDLGPSWNCILLRNSGGFGSRPYHLLAGTHQVKYVVLLVDILVAAYHLRYLLGVI